eukprot:CAMPEP_0198257480 /NCGR_PEP_ID=MMETSP1447-20131203/7155_1 /TAXON_ID=420782 /ORGANISM="Chaetoceros dichaeta, Strain CCMP1751" /LENGTH=408 /DNA_ID=CAMNT_0043944399 /DNA_START=106 /DNA_END=1332 /DNA_ORIENTATION=+
MTSNTNTNTNNSPITGLPLGPFPVGVTTIELTDPNRTDPEDPSEPRRLQTEIWYPAVTSTTNSPKNKFSDFLGGGAIPGSIDRANSPRAIGGYRDGLTVAELDESVWMNDAVRDAEPDTNVGEKWPVVLFSHGAGAFRASYIYWTEFLASYGYVVVAPDHPGSARYTQVGGKVITPDGGPRSKYASMARERPKDMISVLDCLQALTARRKSDGVPPVIDSLLGTTNLDNVAITGMSFGGYTAAEVLELQDPRIQAAVLQCPAIYDADRTKRRNKSTPLMVMLGTEDTVIANRGNDAARKYVDSHTAGDALLVEIVRGGHVSFTSCEIYDAEYGNGIGSQCASLTKPGETYEPLDIVQQHGMINTYGLAFLNTYLRPDVRNDAQRQLLLDAAEGKGPFSEDELIVRSKM